MKYDKSDGEFSMKEQKVSDLNIEKNYSRLSAQNNNCCKFEINPTISDSYNKRLEAKKNIKYNSFEVLILTTCTK